MIYASNYNLFGVSVNDAYDESLILNVIFFIFVNAFDSVQISFISVY